MDKQKLSPEKLDRLSFVKSLAELFEIDLSIKLFGVEVVHFHWPPKSSNS